MGCLDNHTWKVLSLYSLMLSVLPGTIERLLQQWFVSLCQPGPPSGAWEVLDVYCSAYSQINANHNDLLAFFIVVLEIRKKIVFRSYNTYWLSNFNALC